MQEIKIGALELVDKYSERLASVGIKIVLSQRYVETQVMERSGSRDIFDSIERASDRKKEKEKGYNYERNKYRSIVMTVVPLDKTLVGVAECREYAFVFEKTERAHLGLEPRERSYPEERVLGKIEKRILKILDEAGKKSPRKICQNTFWDACRYAHSPKYEYKTRFCEKERFTWDIIFMFLAVAIVVTVILVAWSITKLL